MLDHESFILGVFVYALGKLCSISVLVRMVTLACAGKYVDELLLCRFAETMAHERLTFITSVILHFLVLNTIHDEFITLF